MPYFHHVHHKHPSFRGTKISFLSVVPSISSYSLSRQQWAVMKCHPNQGQTSHTQSQAVWVFETDGERINKSADFANGLQKEKKSPLSPNKIHFWTVSEQFRKAALFTSRDFHGIGYFPIHSMILWQCFGQRISLARTIAEFEFQILQSTQWRLPFQEAL